MWSESLVCYSRIPPCCQVCAFSLAHPKSASAHWWWLRALAGLREEPLRLESASCLSESCSM